MARQRGSALNVRSAAEKSLGSERGRPAALGLAAMPTGGREGSEPSGDRRNRQLALSSDEVWDVMASGVGWRREAVANACGEEGTRGLRKQALPNVWHQRRAQRVRCMPGLGCAA